MTDALPNPSQRDLSVAVRDIAPVEHGPSDPWNALRLQFNRTLALPPFSPNGVDVKAVHAAYAVVPQVPADANFRWGNLEPVGAPIELPPGTTQEQAGAFLVHAWTLLYQAIVHESGLPIIFAGRWGMLVNHQAAFLVCIEAGGLRLVLLPTLSLQGRTIAFSLGHCVLCHQGWMTAHDPSKDADWAHLSSQYDHLFFQPGNAYHEVHLAYHDPQQPARYWHRYRTWMDRLLSGLGGRRWGIGAGELFYTGGEYPGNEIYYSTELHSFFHFKIGERAVPLGSPPGVLYSNVSTLIAKLTMAWRTGFTEDTGKLPGRPRRFGTEIEYQEEQ